MATPEHWIEITLTEDEMEQCHKIGHLRQEYAERRQFQAYGHASAEKHARGYMGETTMAKYLGIPMPSEWTWEADRARGHDVGGYQVRTSVKPDGQLLIRPTDKNGLYVLILTHQMPTFYIVGWTTLQRAKNLGMHGIAPGGGKVKYVAQNLLFPFPNVGGRFCTGKEVAA